MEEEGERKKIGKDDKVTREREKDGVWNVDKKDKQQQREADKGREAIQKKMETR